MISLFAIHWVCRFCEICRDFKFFVLHTSSLEPDPIDRSPRVIILISAQHRKKPKQLFLHTFSRPCRCIARRYRRWHRSCVLILSRCRKLFPSPQDWSYGFDGLSFNSSFRPPGRLNAWLEIKTLLIFKNSHCTRQADRYWWGQRERYCIVDNFHFTFLFTTWRDAVWRWWFANSHSSVWHR